MTKYFINIVRQAQGTPYCSYLCKAFAFVAILYSSVAGELQTESFWTEPVPLTNLNTPADEFAPVWNRFEHQLYFNSTRSGKSVFLVAAQTDSSSFRTAQPVPGELSSGTTNYSYITFQSHDVAYLSAFSQYAAQSQLNIFSTIKRKTTWSKPEQVKSLAADNFNAHPTVSPDGTILIFSSNRNSAEDTDLWISFRTPEGDWSQPIPIQELNTTGNEITPMLQSDDTLYFASDGLGGEGGYDLFVSVRSGGKWQSPLPMKGLNTPYNESDLALLPDGLAVFASDRPGGKGMADLWSASLRTKVIPQPVLVSDLELGVICPTREIRTELDFRYSTVAINPYIFLDDPIGTARKYHPANSVFADSRASTLSESMFIVASRLFEQSDASITIETQPANENEADFLAAKADSLRILLETKYGIAAQRISISHSQPLSGRGSGRLRLSSANKSIFAPLCVGSGNLNVSPERVNMLFEARPREIVDKWDARLFLDNEKEMLIGSKQSLPDSANVDVSSLGAKLLSAETIDIYFNVIDKTGQLTTARHSMLNTVNISRKPNLVRSGDKIWESFVLYAPDTADLRANPAFVMLTDAASESGKSQNCKQIEIVTFSRDAVSAALARNIVSIIGSAADPDAKTATVVEQKSPLDAPFKPEFTVEIRIHK